MSAALLTRVARRRHIRIEHDGDRRSRVRRHANPGGARVSLVRVAQVLAAGCALLVGEVHAQTQQALDLGVETSVERVTYHFDSPSAYDTLDLVPHFFEQYYILDNVWLVGRANYRAGVDWQTEAGLTATREALATDYDTFFNPGGVTWVAGTTGDARVRSFRVSQALDIGRAGPFSLLGGYRLRTDRADFLAGERTDVRNGDVTVRTVTTTREYTTAMQHEVFVEAFHMRDLSDRWQLRLSVQLSPAAIHRLSIQLPDKYPGQTLVFQTVTFASFGQARLTGGSDRWPITLAVDAGRTWRYRPTQWVRRSRASLGIAVGRRW